MHFFIVAVADISHINNKLQFYLNLNALGYSHASSVASWQNYRSLRITIVATNAGLTRGWYPNQNISNLYVFLLITPWRDSRKSSRLNKAIKKVVSNYGCIWDVSSNMNSFSWVNPHITKYILCIMDRYRNNPRKLSAALKINILSYAIKIL